jgi:hypothetical protein
VCREPTVFANQDDEGDGFELWRRYAEDNDQADQWVAWSADEACPQADVAVDTRAAWKATPWCPMP